MPPDVPIDQDPKFPFMLIEGCKHELDIIVPAEEIARETDRVVTNLQAKVKLPGFRPGKTPASIIRSRFPSEVRQDVLENLVPKFFHKMVADEHLDVVGTPNIKDVHFHDGEDLKFKAEFEVAPVIELHDYRGVTVKYQEPEASDEEVEKRIADLREQKAQYVNIDPRPAVEGDHALVSLHSLNGLEKPMRQDEMTFLVGDPDKLPAFSDALRGMSPDEEKEFDVAYPADFGQEELAGKTARFHLKLKMLRSKELPDLNDDFAQDLGDFQTLEQLRDAVRKSLQKEKEFSAQQKAKEEVLDRLIETHEFPVPEAYVERRVETEAQGQFERATGKAIDVKVLKENIDWAAFTAQMRPKALRDVKASLLIERVAEAESIHATNDEVDRELQRIARQEREPIAALRKKMEQSGALGRLAHHIRTEKTLSFLFEHARKEA